MRIATVSAGYADGFERAYSGCRVVIGGERFRQVGRICMDQTLVDITDIPEAQIGDEVTVYSDETFGGSSVDHAADLIGTISYELLCCIGTRVPRIFIENGKEKDILRYI